jgi:glutathione synthase/RimK-type ligase-like ATP-grasp enzyme
MSELAGAAGSPGTWSLAEPTRNLLIVHTPIRQDISDWLSVKRRIEEQAPDIEVRIANNGARHSATRRWQVSRPSLVFSPFILETYEPKGGTVYAGRLLDKLEQVERLARQGVPVPLTARLTRDLAFDPAHWGPYVVAKPLRGSMGRGIRLVPTRNVATLYAELTLNDTREMLVQPYIEHSENGYPTSYRVLTLFGKVLYSARNSWAAPRQALEEIANDPNGIIASNDNQFGRVRMVWTDAEIIALGERAHRAFPECPVLGVDVVRDADTGKLYVMEINPIGDTWHFSSLAAKNFYTAEYVRALYAQFGALDRVAQLLIEKTRAEAT